MSALTATALADGLPEPVGEYGGRWIGRRDIRVLDVSVPAVRRIDRTTLAVTDQKLDGADAVLDPYGLAVPGDGTTWVLADRGRFVFRFSEASGKLVEKRRLSDPCQGIASFWDWPAFVAVRLRADERLLLRFEQGVLRPFSRLASRAAADPTLRLIRNLLRCGSGTAGAIPCWFMAGEPEVFLIAPGGSIRRLAVPSFASPSRAGREAVEPGAAFCYPVRDAFLDEQGLWILSNQEGDRTPLEDGALRSRHVALLREGRPARIVTLAREARAILDASARRLALLYADGAVATVPVP